MPDLYLIGGPSHRQGTHTVHCPKIDGEGKPATGAEKGLVSVTFENGRASVDNVGIARWLQENGHASLLELPAYDLCQPGVGPVFDYDDAGNKVELEPAKPATVPPVDAATPTSKK
jgi:hypothetical protein